MDFATAGYGGVGEVPLRAGKELVSVQWRNDQGFTLLELIITIALVGLVIAAFPFVRGMLPEIQVNKAARGLAEELSEARSMAVKYGSDVIVAIDPTLGTIKTYIDADRDGIQVGDLARSRSLADFSATAIFRPVTTTGPDGLPISQPVKMGTTSSPIAVTFRANGAAVNAGIAYLTDATDHKVELGRAVEVLTTGKVLMWRFDINGTPGPWQKWI